jgi:hypothetical protein
MRSTGHLDVSIDASAARRIARQSFVAGSLFDAGKALFSRRRQHAPVHRHLVEHSSGLLISRLLEVTAELLRPSSASTRSRIASALPPSIVVLTCPRARDQGQIGVRAKPARGSVASFTTIRSRSFDAMAAAGEHVVRLERERRRPSCALPRD